MKRVFGICCFTAVFFSINFKTMAQVTISGPNCVLLGTEYQYNLVGNIPANAQLCVTGGTISGNSGNCTTSLNAGFVRIIWNTSNGSISFSSSVGSSSKTISATVQLQAGLITAHKTQYINYNSSPANISCSGPSGGACNASYSYQWQRSTDNLKWENITSATNQNLNGISNLTQTIFYRRKTTDNVSGSIAYSDSAVVYVEINSN